LLPRTPRDFDALVTADSEWIGETPKPAGREKLLQRIEGLIAPCRNAIDELKKYEAALTPERLDARNGQTVETAADRPGAPTGSAKGPTTDRAKPGTAIEVESKVLPQSPESDAEGAQSTDEDDLKCLESQASKGSKRTILVTLFRNKAFKWDDRMNSNSIAGKSSENGGEIKEQTVRTHTRWLIDNGFIEGSQESGNSGYWLTKAGKNLGRKLAKS
jgi:hypothetical protein